MKKNSYKKFAVGLLSGAFILAGSSMLVDTAQAAESLDQPVQVQEQVQDQEQNQEQHYSYVAKHIAERGNVEEATALQLLQGGYHGRDIDHAGIIAKAAGKDIRDVLSMKKINNRWSDVAAALGVALEDLRSQDQRGPHHGGPAGEDRGFANGHGHGQHHGGQPPCNPPQQ